MSYGNGTNMQPQFTPNDGWHASHDTMTMHWGRDNMAAISQKTFSNAFSWMKIYGCRLTFHWNLFLRVELTIFQMDQIMAWRRTGDKSLSEPMIVGLPTHICVTRPQCVNARIRYFHIVPSDRWMWETCQSHMTTMRAKTTIMNCRMPQILCH